MHTEFDVIVVGAGHAGCEAALASARMGMSTALLTINLDTIAQMSCNPAIGGLAKGQLVREIDALGGEMAKVTDKKAIGIIGQSGIKYKAKAVILTTGTFLKGLIHIGEFTTSGGRIGELSSEKLSDSLRRNGFEVGRLKTGTSPRLNGRTIDYKPLTPQCGDEYPQPFSFSTEKIDCSQVPCYITYTNPATHKIITSNLYRAPLYTGQIKSVGPRYCPSLEDKVVRFSGKDQHQIFLEPEGLNTLEVYCNGIPTSMPHDVQESIVHSITGLESAEILRYGYAIEYDFVPPPPLRPSLETKLVENLFHAGQIKDRKSTRL